MEHYSHECPHQGLDNEIIEPGAARQTSEILRHRPCQHSKDCGTMIVTNPSVN